MTEHFTPLHPFSSDLGAFLQDGGSARLRTHSYTRTYTRTTVESVEYCCGSQCDRAVERILEITRSLSSRNTFCFFKEYLLFLQVVRFLSSSNTIVVWNEYVQQFHVFTVASMNHSSHPWKSHISLLQKSPIKETILPKIASIISVILSLLLPYFLSLVPSHHERWGAGVETQKNVRGVFGGWGRVPFNEPYAPSLSTIYDGA